VASFVQEIISTKGTALEGTLSRGGSYFLVIISGLFGTLLSLLVGYWIVVKIHLLSGDQVWELNWRLGRGGMFGLFEKEGSPLVTNLGIKKRDRSFVESFVCFSANFPKPCN
jgi:hypothetical protein